MLKKLNTLAILLLSTFCFASAQRTNLEIIDSLISSNTKILLESEVGKEIISDIRDNPVAYLNGESYLIVTLSGYDDFPINTIDTLSTNYRHFAWKGNPVNYKWEPESGRIIRLIKPDYTLSIRDKDANTLNTRLVSTAAYTDTIDLDMLAYVGQSDYSFTSPSPPPKPTTIWDSVLEPVVVVGSAILSVWLLFSIRS